MMQRRGRCRKREGTKESERDREIQYGKMQRESENRKRWIEMTDSSLVGPYRG